MKVNLGTYSKNNKKLSNTLEPKVQPRLDRKALARKVINNRRVKENIPQNKNSKKTLKMFMTLILVVAIGFGVWRYINYKSKVQCSEGSESCIGFSPKDILGSFKPTLKKTDEFTNVLIVGIDTREYDQGLKNTDTIMVASINHEQKKAMLISIPRDLLVTVDNEYGNRETRKINSVFAIGESKEEGMDILENNIENWLGLDIHYSTMVNFNAVKDAVDAMGGVEITVKDRIPVLYPQDNPPYDYDLITFEPGVQSMDGYTALVWARFRQVYSNNSNALQYGSDFSRAERQQEVIDALKVKALADESSTADKAQKYWKLYQSMSDNIQLKGVSAEDLLAGLTLMTDFDQNPVNVVLDPTFGGMNTLIYEDDSYNIIVRDNSWQNIQNEISQIWENPGIYDDEALVVISNRTGLSFGIDSKAMELENRELPFGGLFIISQPAIESTGVTIIDYSGGTKQRTIEFLKEYFNTDKVITDPVSAGIKQSGYYEDIKIEIGMENQVDQIVE